MKDEVVAPKRSDHGDDAGRDENDPPFLKLPAELRVIIYRYAAVNSTPVQLSLGDVDRSRFRNPDRRPLLINVKPHPHPLALTCRKVYLEFRPVYLVESTFCLSNLTTMETLHVDYIKQFRKMMGQFARKVKKVSIDYRFYSAVEVASTDESVSKHIWVKLSVLLDEGGALRIETRAGTFAKFCYCGLSHLAANHSAGASDTKILDFLEAMFKVASRHHCHDVLRECRKCGGMRRSRVPRWPQTGKDRLVVW